MAKIYSMPRSFAKIKITGHKNEKEYSKLYAREYRKRFGKDVDRVPGYKQWTREYNKKYREQEGYREYKAFKRNEQRRQLRIEILTHYSNGTLQCAHCSFDDIRALDLDHINNAGGKIRKLGHIGQTYSIYYRLKREGFSPGYQVLCRNCNWIKELERREKKEPNDYGCDPAKQRLEASA